MCNLVSTCVLRDSGDLLRSGLHGDQFGVRSAGLGMQAAVFKAQHMAKSMNGKVILKIDLKNAFNTINRSRCASAWATCDHDSAAWVSWCLSQPSNVLFNSQVLSCTNGVQQGEPLSPLLFALGINDVISSLGSMPGLDQIWYLDDGFLHGPRLSWPVHFSNCKICCQICTYS